MTDLLIVLGSNAALVVAVMVGVLVASRILGRVSVVDVAWGLGFVLVALLSALLGGHTLGWLLFVLTALWGLRLAWYIALRSRGHGEDPRYEELLARGGSVVGKVLVPQGVAMWFVSLPLQVAAWEAGSLTWLAVVGVLVWGTGLAFEVIGDRQLAAYKADPDRPPVMDRGLWGWTRHPNYFGDAVVWWGLWLVAASGGGLWAAVLTMPAPLAMTWFLRNATGAKLLERSMMKRPGYAEYAARVPMFFPRPPR